MYGIAGAAIGILGLAGIAALVMTILRFTVFRTGRVRFFGWSPSWYVGGQPDVPRELQEGRRRRRR